MGQAKKKRENKWAGRANLKKSEKTNGSVGLKTGSGAGQPKENEKKKGLVGAKNRRQGGSI